MTNLVKVSIIPDARFDERRIGGAMGVDLHIGDHYWPLGHVPTAVLVVGAVIAVVVIWKLRRFILAAITGWHPS